MPVSGSQALPSVGAKSKTAAVVIAIKDEIRKKKIENIKASAGDMKFDIEAGELRHEDERLGF